MGNISCRAESRLFPAPSTSNSMANREDAFLVFIESDLRFWPSLKFISSMSCSRKCSIILSLIPWQAASTSGLACLYSSMGNDLCRAYSSFFWFLLLAVRCQCWACFCIVLERLILFVMLRSLRESEYSVTSAGVPCVLEWPPQHWAQCRNRCKARSRSTWKAESNRLFSN